MAVSPISSGDANTVLRTTRKAIAIAMEWCLIKKRCAVSRGEIPDQIDRVVQVLVIAILTVPDHMTGDTTIGGETIGMPLVSATLIEIEDGTATETEIEAEIDIVMTAIMTDVGDDLSSCVQY